MAPPSPADPAGVVSVRSITRIAGGLVSVSLRLPSGGTRTYILPSQLVSYDNICFTARAVGELIAIATPGR